MVAKDERRIRIEVGYGLEGTVPDALARRVIDGIMMPRFREGDFSAGIEEAVEALAGLIRGDTVDLPEGSTELTGFEDVLAVVFAGGIFFIVVGVGVLALGASAQWTQLLIGVGAFGLLVLRDWWRVRRGGGRPSQSSRSSGHL